MAVATAGNGNGTALATPPTGESKTMSYVPFGAQDQIKLSVKIVQEMVCTKTRSGKICSEVEAFKFMMLCQARKLNPFEGDCFLIGYDSDDGKATFSLITAHQAFLKRAEVHPEFDGMESGVMVRDENTGNIIDREGDFVFDTDFILGGWAVVHFKHRRHPMKKRVALKTFTTGKSRWKADPCGMIVKVAEADALRSAFPTMLGGLYTEGEKDLTFVNDPTPAAKPEIPLGRTKLKDLKATTPAKVPTNGDETIDAETATEPSVPPTTETPKADFDLDAADQWYMKFEADIGDAISVTGMQKIGADLEERKAILGKANYDELMVALQAKNRELMAAKKK